MWKAMAKAGVGNGMLVVCLSKTLLRAVTHLDVNPKDIEKTIEVFRKAFK
jgi:hypothetical protein